MRLASALLGGLAASVAAASSALCQTVPETAAWTAPAPIAIDLPADPATSDTGAWRGLIWPSQVWPSMSGGAIDRFSLAAGDGLHAPDGRPLVIGRFGDEGRFGERDISRLARDWPAAVRWKTGSWGFDVTPRAGFGLSRTGNAQQAGALLRFGRGLGGGGEVSRHGRWYLFASTDREQLGLGFLRGEDPWKRAGLGPDPGAVIGDTRAGVAWSDGPFEASVGYLHRDIRPHDFDMIDVQAAHEEAVGFKVAFHPGLR